MCSSDLLTTKHLGTTLGVFTGASGVANTTFQWFCYRDSTHRDTCRAALLSDPAWIDYVRQASPTIVQQTNTLIVPTTFSALRDIEGIVPVSAGSPARLFELRSYVCFPGKLPTALEILEHEGVALAHKYVENPIGYFLAETGVVNRILMLWAYSSSAERDRRWTAMRTDPAFKDLAARMNACFLQQEVTLLTPTPYSPLR